MCQWIQLKLIQSEIDNWHGKGELLKIVSTAYFTFVPTSAFNKVEVVSKRFMCMSSELELMSDDGTDIDMYEYEYYE